MAVDLKIRRRVAMKSFLERHPGYYQIYYMKNKDKYIKRQRDKYVAKRPKAGDIQP